MDKFIQIIALQLYVGRETLGTPLRGTLVIIAAVGGLSALASAQTSDLHGIALTTNVAAMHQSFVSAPVASLSGLSAIDAIGNEAAADASLSRRCGSQGLIESRFSNNRRLPELECKPHLL